MFISPLTAIKEGWITHPDCKTIEDWQSNQFISPNAIDITLDRVFHMQSTSTFIITEDVKHMRKTQELFPITHKDGIDNLFMIQNGCVDVMSSFYVTIPEGVAAFLIVRSSLNRNGLFVTSGLYDQGFSNYIGFVLHNRGHLAFIAPKTRVAQIVFVKSEDSGVMYNGIYNSNSGEHWSEIQQPTSIEPDTESVDTPVIIADQPTTTTKKKNPTKSKV